MSPSAGPACFLSAGRTNGFWRDRFTQKFAGPTLCCSSRTRKALRGAEKPFWPAGFYLDLSWDVGAMNASEVLGDNGCLASLSWNKTQAGARCPNWHDVSSVSGYLMYHGLCMAGAPTACALPVFMGMSCLCIQTLCVNCQNGPCCYRVLASF